MSNLQFDPSTHTYRLDGAVIPSVTQVLKEAGLIDTTWYSDNPNDADRGTYVHKLTELDDTNELDELQVCPDYLGYLEAWRAFRAERRFTLLAIESRVYHPTYRYAGKLDRAVSWRGYEAVLDLKTGSPAAWHALQTAAYRACRHAAVRLAVYLKPNGTYSVREHKDKDDWPTFVGALTVANWKRNHNLIKEYA